MHSRANYTFLTFFLLLIGRISSFGYPPSSHHYKYDAYVFEYEDVLFKLAVSNYCYMYKPEFTEKEVNAVRLSHYPKHRNWINILNSTEDHCCYGSDTGPIWKLYDFENKTLPLRVARVIGGSVDAHCLDNSLYALLDSFLVLLGLCGLGCSLVCAYACINSFLGFLRREKDSAETFELELITPESSRFIPSSDEDSDSDTDTSYQRFVSTKIKHPHSEYTLTTRVSESVKRIASLYDGMFVVAEKEEGVEPGFICVKMDERFFEIIKQYINEEKRASFRSLDRFAQRFYGNLESVVTLDDNDEKRRQFVEIMQREERWAAHSRKYLLEYIAKFAVTDSRLETYMGKLDYPDEKGSRKKYNDKALYEYMGSYLGRIFSRDSQIQRLSVLELEKKRKLRFLLLSKWKAGLISFKNSIHNPSEGLYRSVLVCDRNAEYKTEVLVEGLGKYNLFLACILSDWDSLGKNLQNKAAIHNDSGDLSLFGFDYGHAFSLSSPSIHVGSLTLKLEHYAFRRLTELAHRLIGTEFKNFNYPNYSIFDDTPISERAHGLHMIRFLLTGERPDKYVLDTFIGLAGDLEHIERNIPTLDQLREKESDCRKCLRHPYFVERTDKLGLALQDDATPLERCFLSIKYTLIKVALLHGQFQDDLSGFDEIAEYLRKIHSTQKRVRKNTHEICEKLSYYFSLPSEIVTLIYHLDVELAKEVTLRTEDLIHKHIKIVRRSGDVKLEKNDDGSYNLFYQVDELHKVSEIKQRLKTIIGFPGLNISSLHNKISIEPISLKQLRVVARNLSKSYDSKYRQLERECEEQIFGSEVRDDEAYDSNVIFCPGLV